MGRYGGAVTVVLVTGLSGTGKTAALAELARRGHRVVDTDLGGYAEEVPFSDEGGWEQLWREDRIAALLDQHDEGVLFLSGCVANQGKFYPRFEAVVLLSAPVDVILERVATRDTNNFGKSERERRRIRHFVRVLRRRSTRVRPWTRWWTRLRASRTPCGTALKGPSASLDSSRLTARVQVADWSNPLPTRGR